MIRLGSIRVKLTVWYTFMLFVGLVILGSIMWMGIQYSLRASVQSRLADRLEAVVQPVASGAGNMRERLRTVVREPESASRILPEVAEEIRALRSEEERERFVDTLVTGMTEVRMQDVAQAMPPGEYLEVRSASGKIVAAKDGADPFPWPDSLAEDPFKPLEFSGELYVAHMQAFEVQGQPYIFYTATSVETIRESGHRMMSHLPWAVLVFLALSTLGGWLIASRALRPVDEIVGAARSISIEDLSHRLEVPQTGDEIERLATTWNKMLGRLESAVGKLSQFTADASHELRTPTAVIRTTAELALRRERPAQEYREALERIQRESGRMSQLVEDLLVLARAEADLDTMPMATVDLGEIARDVCQDYRILAESKNLEFEWTVPDGSTVLHGNASSLRRVLIVLLDNAIKYTSGGGTVTLGIEHRGGSPLIEVRDTGDGIGPEDLPKIFDRFYRADRSRNRSAGSHGLGLAMAKWIVDKHSGKIEVESTEGEGSVFRVLFPSSSVPANGPVQRSERTKV